MRVSYNALQFVLQCFFLPVYLRCKKNNEGKKIYYDFGKFNSNPLYLVLDAIIY